MPPKAQWLSRFSGLWHKIKRDSSTRALHISEGDVAIFVVGPTGSGKSWFIREATNNNLIKVSKGYHPCTTYVEAIRCELTDHEVNLKSVVLVDTPSFLTGRDHPDPQEEIRVWLDRTQYKPRHAGIIYVHRIETDPTLDSVVQHLQEFSAIRRLGDYPVPHRVHIVLSYDTSSSNIAPPKIAERRSKLHGQVDSCKDSKWQLSMHQGLFQGDPRTAWSVIEELLRDLPEPASPS